MLVVGLLVGGCASDASPAPIATPTRSEAPATSSAFATPSPLLTATPNPPAESSAAGSGWPYALTDSEPVFGPDGTVYLLARDGQGAYQRILIALDATGHVKPGWSIEAPSGTVFGSLAVGPDGSVYIEERGSLAVGSMLHRLGATERRILAGADAGS